MYFVNCWLLQSSNFWSLQVTYSSNVSYHVDVNMSNLCVGLFTYSERNFQKKLHSITMEMNGKCIHTSLQGGVFLVFL